MSAHSTTPGPHTPSAMERVGGLLFASRNVVFPVAIITLLAVLSPVPLRDDGGADRWLNAVGFLIATMGQLLRAAVIGFVYVKRGGKDGQVYADKLVTTGFFRHSRNPLYVGNLLILAGLVVIHNHPLAYLLGLPLGFLAYACIVAAEEAYLGRRFGAEYTEYCRTVPRWTFNFRGLTASLAGRKLNLGKIINKEYTTTLSWVAGALAMLAREILFAPQYPHQLRDAQLIAAATLCLIVFWAVARYFKKTERARKRRAAARFPTS